MAAPIRIRPHDPNPTLIQMVQWALQASIDRISLVRHPDVTRESGIFVCMLSKAAIREVGTICERAARTFDNEKWSEQTCWLKTEEPVYMAFDHIAKKWPSKRGFAWGNYELDILVNKGGKTGKGSLNVLVAAFVGTEFCAQLAPKLTQVRCITYLR